MKRQAGFPPMAPPPKRTDSVMDDTISESTVRFLALAKVPPALMSLNAQLSLQSANAGGPVPALLARKAAPPLTHRSFLDFPQEKARPQYTPPSVAQKARPVKAPPVSTLVAVTKASFEPQRRIWLQLSQLAESPLQRALEDASQLNSMGSSLNSSLPLALEDAPLSHSTGA